jgi:uncharacterized protein
MKKTEALRLLTAVKCPQNVIDHCIAVSEKAVSIAKKAQKDHDVDMHVVEIGGLLHDIGRACTHGIDHGIVGAHLLRERGINGKLQRICERHLCAGIPKQVAESIGLPPQDYVPQTMEEKIICHADNLTNHTLEELQAGWKDFFGTENGKTIVALLDNLHRELEKYL